MYKNRIRQYRKSKGMNLEEFTKKVHISTGYLCHLEIGSRKNPSMQIMEKISNELNKTIAEVFFPESQE